MSKSNLRYLMHPDVRLPQERRDVLKERVMASVRTEPQEQPKTRSRLRHRLAPTLASVAAVVLIAGVAAAVGLFPRQAQEQLDELGCRDAASSETLVATADATDGRTFQFWTTSQGPDALPNGFVLVEVSGDSAGGTIGCNTPGDSLGEIWVATPAEASIQGTLVSVMGHVPVSATVVEVT
ncbi:MAG TPA: anti-sigma factor, partial [Actinobacteria bacterium]|nr:anti-sigma factor [Actinomycetota bacterium]